jgi:glycosyltransferase involved in cell wall biosynthesis
MKVKIGIDARELEKPSYGVARYIKNVINTLISSGNDFELYPYFKDRIPDEEYLKNVGIKSSLVKLPSFINRDIIWQQIFLPIFLRRDKIDIFFSGQYTIPYYISIPAICTVHDLSYFVNPLWFPRREGFLLRLISKICLKKAAKIIASSQNTAKDIAKYLSIRQEKIITNYPGLSDNFFSTPKMEDKSIRMKHSIKNNYILWIGSILNRRNINLLLSAYEDIARKFEDIDLVIIGEERCSPRINLQNAVDMHIYSDKIHYFKYVTEDDLLAFYDNSSLFVFLSEYEGFGYTPLEAASRGIPVILHDNPTFREIFGSYARFIDGKESLVEAVTDVLHNQYFPDKIVEYQNIISDKYRADVNNKNLISIFKNMAN